MQAISIQWADDVVPLFVVLWLMYPKRRDQCVHLTPNNWVEVAALTSDKLYLCANFSPRKWKKTAPLPTKGSK